MTDWQTRATEFAQKHNLQHPAGVYVLDLLSELGEVGKEVLLATDYGKRPFQPTPNLPAELGDLLYSLCLLASASGVDLEQAFSQTLDKYEKRWQTNQHIGSTGD